MTLWSHMTADYHRLSTPRLVARPIRQLPGGSILVAHDSAPNAIANVSAILGTLTSSGRTLDQLPVPDEG
jgi:hypothetical protein